jgi:hypothetical protein
MDTIENITTFEQHKELNPAIWEGKVLRPVVKNRLLDIAEAFIEYVDYSIDVNDITITGSLANYNYTKYSDLDLHIIADLNDLNSTPDLLKKFFKAKCTIWNTTRNITIKGYDVEIYVQSAQEPHYSTGVYSLKNDEWLQEPKYISSKDDIDIKHVQQKLQTMLDMINFALGDECDAECAAATKEKFMKIRKAGLEVGGEYSPENLAFKALRRSGDIERLFKGVWSKTDKKLSLDSLQKENLNFKDFTNISNKRGPRHQSLTAGVNKLVNAEPGKSISMVAQMHKRKPTDSVPVHNFKKRENSLGPISTDEAMEIISRYNLNIEKIRNGESRELSTSGIKIGFNPQANTFYLSK